MKALNLVLGLLVLAAWLLPGEAKAARQMVQCENCSTFNQMKNVALQRGDGEYFVFSLQNSLLLRFIVTYDHETHSNWVRSPLPGQTMENAFALMLDANELKPGIFAGQQILYGDINRIGGGTHDPVEISLNGTHDDAYGAFINNAQICMESQACATTVNSELGKIAGAEFLLNSLGFSIHAHGVGGNINWESLPPGFKLWLCNSNNDCALLKYENNEWVYIESRAERGNGKRYPKYGENLNYGFDNSGEASIFERGLRNGGAQVRGSYRTRTLLVCTGAGGAAMTCQYVIVPE